MIRPVLSGIARERVIQLLCAALVPALLFGVLAFASISLTRGDGRIAAVWLPNAFAIAALLRWRMRPLPAVFSSMWLGNVAANLLVGDTIMKAAGLSAANMIEIGIVVFAMHARCDGVPNMHRLRDVMQLCLIGGLIAPAVSATIASVTLQPDLAELASTWGEWALTDALGILIVTPALMIFGEALRNPRWPTRGELAEWSVLAICGTALTLYVFLQTSYPFLFLVAPVVVAHAFRLGALGTVFSLVKVAIVAIACTWAGRGPIHLADASVEGQMVVLQLFLASIFVMSLPIATAWQGIQGMLEKIEEQKREYALLADNMADAVLRYAPDGTCLYASPSVRDVLGAPSGEFVGSSSLVRAHPEAAEKLREVTERLGSGKSDTERFTYRRLLDCDDGKPVYIEAFCQSIRAKDGTPESIIVSARDVTAQVELERLLVRARRHAEAAATAKSEFLANMSHEIRTPMNGVLGFAELLLRGKIRGVERRHVELIADSGRSMMALLNDILDISKIEAGKIVVSEEATDLRHLVSHCRRLNAVAAEKKGVTLREDIAFDVPDVIVSDPQRLEQIMHNLVGNAVKFTDEGSITLRAHTSDDILVMVVEDTGVGIAEDRLAAIFEPFTQADGKTSRRFGGTGLGLTISRQLAELLGGELTATSVEGRGSRFELRLPLKVADEPTVPSGDTEQIDESALPAPARILLAEDVDINQILATSMLQTCGQKPEIASDGKQAVRMVTEAQATGKPYALVLMDIQMPECDGYEASRRIREAGIGADTLPIIALTANAFSDDVDAARNVGMQDHISKPLRRRNLVQALIRWLPNDDDERSEASDETRPANPVAAAPASDIVDDASNELEAMWEKRRKDTLEIVAELLRKSDRGQADFEHVAREVHKLAGTAGMFGEEQLGELAATLEHVLRGEDGSLSVDEAAKQFLKAA